MMRFNRRGQATGGVNIFTVLFVAIAFIACVALGFGSMINTMIGIGVAAGNVTGIEAFFLNNFLLIILFVFLLWFLIAMSSG